MSALLFSRTPRQSPAVNLREALLAGQAPDRGLYFPEKFPRLTPAEIAAYADDMERRKRESDALIAGEFSGEERERLARGEGSKF